MNTISGSSTFSASSKGMSGLASGLDTESMVEGMLSGTQNKIDKQNATKQQLVWKQEIYRTIISQLNLFQSKYFDPYYSSSTNLLSNAFFNSMSAISKSSAISATASSSAPTGRTSVEVRELATKSKYSSGSPVSGELSSEIADDAIQTLTDRRITLEENGTTVQIDLSGAASNQDIVDKINAASTAAGTKFTAKLDDTGKLRITTTEDEGVQVKDGSILGLKMVGLSKGAKGVKGVGGFGSDSYTLTSDANAKAVVEVDVNLDGVIKKVKLDLNHITNPGTMTKEQQATALRQALQKGVDAAHGSGQIVVGGSGTEITLKTPTAGRTIIMGGASSEDDDALKALGMVRGLSNTIAVGSKLGEVNFTGAKLQGNNFKFTINGEEFSFTKNHTIGEVMSAINSSDAGVRISYVDYEDKFHIESLSTGAGHSISMTQTEGNLLSSMFGVATGGSAQSGSFYVGTSFAPDGEVLGATSGIDIKANAAFNVIVDGVFHTFTLPEKDGDPKTYTSQEAVENLNKQFEKKFGAGVIKIDETTGEFKFKEGIAVSIPATSGNFEDADGNFDPGLAALLGETDLNFALGFGRVSVDNTAKGANTLGEVGALTGNSTINFTDSNGIVTSVTLTANTKLEDIEALTGGKIKFSGGKLTLADAGELTVTGADANGKSFLNKAFGSEHIELNMAQGTAPVFTQGQNAVVVINGVETERSTNSFTVGGITLTLNETTGKYRTDADGNFELDANGNKIFDGEAVDINVTRDTESIFNGIKSFVDDYNKLVDTLGTYTGAKATYKNYPPLTESQRKDMTDKEIELWEEKSKEGLLRNDSDIGMVMQAMRSILYTKPAGSDYALFELGIETGSNWKDNGKLKLDESKLKSMIESNPEGVQSLFTGADGLASQMRTAIEAAAKTSSAAPGTLVKLAGADDTATVTENTITKRITEINDRIKELKKKYETEKARYWNQFNQMEKLISQMNSQSSWLAQQFA